MPLQVVGAVQRQPTLTGIVLECTNMPPCAVAQRRATDVRVHDITSLDGARMARIRGTNAHIA